MKTRKFEAFSMASESELM